VEPVIRYYPLLPGLCELKMERAKELRYNLIHLT
jgi:hypothetical protein